MKNTHSGMVVGFALLASACTQSVGETRMVMAPVREPNCKLEFVQVDLGQLSDPNSEWELLGQIVLSDLGEADPTSPAAKKVVHPRACKMGGEAVAVLMNATSQNGLSSGSALAYGVLRKRQPKSQTPTQF